MLCQPAYSRMVVTASTIPVHVHVHGVAEKGTKLSKDEARRLLMQRLLDVKDCSELSQEARAVRAKRQAHRVITFSPKVRFTPHRSGSGITIM